MTAQPEETVTETQLRAAIAAERRELATVLAALSPEMWDASTLCEGWRVREVVAHMTMAFRYSVPKFLLGMLAAGGNFTRMADRAARRDAAALTSEQLAACMADNVDHPWKPPGAGYVGALSHDIIHGLDFTVPLGLERRVPLDRLQIVLGSQNPQQISYFGVDLDGIRLCADDLDWTYGTGSELHGSAQDLLLVQCGRKLPAGRLTGATSPRFTAR